MQGIWDFLAQKLGIPDLRERVSVFEKRIDNFEKFVNAALQDFGNKQDKTDEELNIMKNQINNILTSIENMIKSGENREMIQDAKSLRRRLTNHKTRLINILKKRGIYNG